MDNEFTEKLRNVVNAFHDPKLATLIQRQGGTKLKNYPDTRFCYVRDTCDSILKNLEFLKNVSLIEDVNINENVFETIFHENFETDLNNTIQNLTPICKLINKCQGMSYNVADATELWLSLELPTNDFNDIIKARIKKAVWPVGYAANLMHPKYRGRLFDDNQRRIADNFLLENLNPEAVHEMQDYLSDIERFNSLAEKCESPISFWSWCDIKYPNLSKVVIKLMLIPAGTGILEAYFSN